MFYNFNDMKILENLLNILVRILNIPLMFLTVIAHLLICVLLLFIVSPLEFAIVMPVYYIVTGNWYYEEWNHSYPYRKWFPIATHMDFYLDKIPCLTLNEFDLNKNKKDTKNNGE